MESKYYLNDFGLITLIKSLSKAIKEKYYNRTEIDVLLLYLEEKNIKLLLCAEDLLVVLGTVDLKEYSIFFIKAPIEHSSSISSLEYRFEDIEVTKPLYINGIPSPQVVNAWAVGDVLMIIYLNNAFYALNLSSSSDGIKDIRLSNNKLLYTKDNSTWVNFVNIDSSVISGSPNLITGGAVAARIENLGETLQADIQTVSDALDSEILRASTAENNLRAYTKQAAITSSVQPVLESGTSYVWQMSGMAHPSDILSGGFTFNIVVPEIKANVLTWAGFHYNLQQNGVNLPVATLQTGDVLKLRFTGTLYWQGAFEVVNLSNKATRENLADTEERISDVEHLIPELATSQNQLADKNFVNSSIATNTATFRGTAPKGLTEALFIEWANALLHDSNDYVFWPTTDSEGNVIYKRYKYSEGSGWIFEYDLNNSSFTQEQWATINSGTNANWKSSVDLLLELAPTFAAKTEVLNLSSALLQEVSRATSSEQYLTELKANKDEMTITEGSGADLGKTTIQLKLGLQTTVLNEQKLVPIEDAINNEVTAREQAIETLDSKISANTLAITAEKTRAEGVEQNLDSKIAANTAAIATEKTRAEGIEQTLQLAIDTINGKIPAQATSQNQLADKAFVNSSVSTATADFKGTYNSLEDLQQVTANANDYAFVIANDAAGNTLYKRYKWVEGTGWVWEYDLNNSSFTQAQWAAIQSGITAALVTKLSELPDNSTLNQRMSQAIATALSNYYTKSEIDTALGNKQDVIQDLATIRSGASAGATAVQPAAVSEAVNEVVQGLESGNIIPAMADTLEPWADQKAIATPDTYTDAVRTTGGDIPIETSAGSKLESIKPVAGSKWTAKLLFNGSYNMLNAVKWGSTNSQPYVGGVGNDFVYFLVPELTLGTFGTADENNGLLFTDSEGENVQPASVYFKPLGATVPQSLTDGTSVIPTDVSYDGKTYKDYATSGAGWLIVPKTIYDNDVCTHIAWEDWYNKHVSLNEPTTNPEAVVGVLMLEELLALAHSDKYLRGVNEEVCDNIVFGETSATITHMVDELNVAANAWTNAATGESDSQGNALYRHSTTVSGIKNGGVACIEGNDGGIPLTVNGTTVSYVDTNATAPASVVFYQIPTAVETTKSYSDSIFSGSNINQETGVLPINDCSIEAQVAMEGEAHITVKYAKNIVDQVAINAATDVPKLQEQVEEHEERITELEDTAVRTGSYDASVAVGLADNLKGDTVVDSEFYKRKTGGTQSVGSGIAAIKEVRGKSVVWNQVFKMTSSPSGPSVLENGVTISRDRYELVLSGTATSKKILINYFTYDFEIYNHKYITKTNGADYGLDFRNNGYAGINLINQTSGIPQTGKIHNYQANQYVIVNIPEGASFGTKTRIWFNVFDLTLMFGAGNEPTTVAEFEKMFPLEYYEYNAGEVIPFAAQNLVTTGKNQYNPATGKANLLGGQQYQLLGTYTSATIDEVAVTLDSNNCFTPTKDCVLDVTGGNDTDTIVALYNGEDNTYVPYEKHTLPIDPSQWRDKQGNLVFPYGGMHGVGTVYDYAKVDADGYIRKATSVYGGVDVGDYDYTKQGNLYTTNEFVPSKANILFSRGKSIVWNQLFERNIEVPFDIDNTNGSSGSYDAVGGSQCPKFASLSLGHKYYINVHPTFDEGSDIYDKFYTSTNQHIPLESGSRIWVCSNVTIGDLRVRALPVGKHIYGKMTCILVDLTLMFGAGNEPATPEEFEAMFPLDSYVYDAGSLGILVNQTYADAAAFKAAMQGVPLIYELAEPVEIELATPIYAKYLVDKDGTEEITPGNGTAPYTTMADMSILYAMDARGEIKNLPKNYLSKEEAENRFNALVKKGVISQTQTWTKAADGGYDYVMSKLVYGDIPRANIDLFASGGAVFNETTGYFELNGLTDISYEEMQSIYNFGPLPYNAQNWLFTLNVIRTNLPSKRTSVNTSWMARDATIEVFAFNPNNVCNLTDGTYPFYSAKYTKDIRGIINVSAYGAGSRPFENMPSLVSIQLHSLKGSMSFSNSRRLSLASILYMINNEVATSAITITLHATVYARAIADTDIQTALQNHPNVTLASAT